MPSKWHDKPHHAHAIPDMILFVLFVAANYRGMSARERAAIAAHHDRLQSQKAETHAWGPPPERPPRPPSGRRPLSAKFTQQQQQYEAAPTKDLRFNSVADYYRYTPDVDYPSSRYVFISPLCAI